MKLNVNNTIVLVGLMGAGKSAIGTRLASELALPFYDLDKVIEEREAETVSEIFSGLGEKYFRQRELEVISELLLRDEKSVIATGGGAFMNKEIRDIVRDKATSVWLKADIEILLERVARKNTRPLLENGDKREILAKLIDERYPVYSYADITVDSDNRPYEYMIAKIIAEIDRFQNANSN